MATLRDLGLEPFEVVRLEVAGDQVAGAPLITAPDGRWAVLVGVDGPVSALQPGTSLAGRVRAPGILIAPADLDQGTAFTSPAFRQLTEVSALVLTGPSVGLGDAGAIAGVVSGETLTLAILRGPRRGPTWGITGPVLPGTPSIPLISRSCGYAEGAAMCATAMSFPRRPSPLPQCPNSRGLTAHTFDW